MNIRDRSWYVVNPLQHPRNPWRITQSPVTLHTRMPTQWTEFAITVTHVDASSCTNILLEN